MATNSTHRVELRHVIGGRRERGRLVLITAALVTDARGEQRYVDEREVSAKHSDVLVEPAVLDHCHVIVAGERHHGGPGVEHAIILYGHLDAPGATAESVRAGVAAHYDARRSRR